MADFSGLKNLSEDFDFTQMRALVNRATDEAIISFVGILNDFFSQFAEIEPSLEELQTYTKYMNLILAKINEVEYDFALANYSKTEPEYAHIMAEGVKLSDISKIPTRMQYWAAGESFGDTIRNASEHSKAVEQLARFDRLIQSVNAPQTERRRFSSDSFSFFEPDSGSSSEDPDLSDTETHTLAPAALPLG